MNYKITVVVLVYNTEKYLVECLESLINQTLKNIEIILVNDESTDNSLNILLNYKKMYKNIKIIDQKNTGGATAGNNGLKIAKGEYVTLMDSDDILPPDAYEKLYEKAIVTDADIVIGKPMVLINGQKREIAYKKESMVWREERVLEKISDDYDIFYDVFYWNKLFRRELIQKRECYMPDGMLYADRPMVHKAYVCAKKIAIISDTVYFWRKRGSEANNNISITQGINELENLLDRLESVEYQIDIHLKNGELIEKNEFLKRIVERMFFPLEKLVFNEEHLQIYLERLRKIFSSIDDLYTNDLGVINMIYLYLIVNGKDQILTSFVKSKKTGKISYENGYKYWDLSFFNDKRNDFPRFIFKVNDILSQDVKIEEIVSENGHLRILKGKIDSNVYINEVYLIFYSRKKNDYHKILIDVEKNNEFSMDMELKIFQVPDVLELSLEFLYEKRYTRIRLTDSHIKSIGNSCELTKIYITNLKNISITLYPQLSEFIFEKDRIIVENFDDAMNIYIRKFGTSKKIIFEKSGNDRIMFYDNFIDLNSNYGIYLEFNNISIRIKDMGNNLIFRAKNYPFNIEKDKLGQYILTTESQLIRKLKKLLKKLNINRKIKKI
jgi:Predicted glycosyltransferases